MSSFIRSLGVATLIALALMLVPASVAPTGGLEVNGLCASAECRNSPGSFCMAGGPPILNKKTVIG